SHASRGNSIEDLDARGGAADPGDLTVTRTVACRDPHRRRRCLECHPADYEAKPLVFCVRYDAFKCPLTEDETKPLVFWGRCDAPGQSKVTGAVDRAGRGRPGIAIGTLSCRHGGCPLRFWECETWAVSITIGAAARVSIGGSRRQVRVLRHLPWWTVARTAP